MMNVSKEMLRLIHLKLIWFNFPTKSKYSNQEPIMDVFLQMIKYYFALIPNNQYSKMSNSFVFTMMK